jgi:hypothetical protein
MRGFCWTSFLMCDFKAKLECFKSKTNSRKKREREQRTWVGNQSLYKMSLLYSTSPFLFSSLIEGPEPLSFLIHEHSLWCFGFKRVSFICMKRNGKTTNFHELWSSDTTYMAVPPDMISCEVSSWTISSHFHSSLLFFQNFLMISFN